MERGETYAGRRENGREVDEEDPFSHVPLCMPAGEGPIDNPLEHVVLQIFVSLCRIRLIAYTNGLLGVVFTEFL